MIKGAVTNLFFSCFYLGAPFTASRLLASSSNIYWETFKYAAFQSGW